MTKKLEKKKGNWKRAMAIGATALVTSGALWWIGIKNHQFPVPSYRAMRVIDGDTFETEEHQLIRVAEINAPEMGNCNGPEAKVFLEKLLLNQNLYIKVIFRDRSNRLISHVYNQNGLVSGQMISSGMAYFDQSGQAVPELLKASASARDHRLGVYSSKCVQQTNKAHPDCVIKGNLRDRPVIRTYHFPGCGQYNHTALELSRGDEWFCSEKEAEAAGFKKGADCFDKSWR